MRSVDQIIVGQGLAGSTLAWHLSWLNQRVVIVDRDEANTASKISSGLVSPITGKRNAVSWRFDELWAEASAFYRQVERLTGSRCWHNQSMLKVVLGAADEELDSIRTYGQRSETLAAPLNKDLKAIELAPAGRLDVTGFLASTRTKFESINVYQVADLKLPEDIQLADGSVTIPKLNLAGRCLIFCQGIAARENPWFSRVPFDPTKGEVLTLVVPDYEDERVINHGVWLTRIGANATGESICLAGATYERNFDSVTPTNIGRDEILSGLSIFGPREFEVVDHRAGLRPTIQGRLPKVGQSMDFPQLGFFNGLGSKGALRAPFVAKQFARQLVHGEPVDEEIRLQTAELQPSTKRKPQPVRLTEVAHQKVAEVLRVGDVAIDATTGNGFDCRFLSQTVGATGRVFGFDIQQEALDRTRAKLNSISSTNVTLLCASHERLQSLIPSELHGRISAVMMNLGYLPRGDKHLTTQANSTIAAIKDALSMLRVGGIVTIVAYTGHDGGLAETRAVANLLESLDREHWELSLPDEPLKAGPPRLYCVWKKQPVSH